MNIAGFKISKKALIIVIGVVALFFIITFASNKAKQAKEEEEAQKKQAEFEAEMQRQLQEMETVGNDEFTYDFDAEMQKDLVKQYGEPPEGFKWSITGELISLSDDTSLPEDVLYYFLRSLSVLDMSTAERYSSNSQVVQDYSSNYSELSSSITDYYRNFIRKQYKASLLSLEVLSTGSKSTMANGDMYISVNIRSLDLTDKDFWQKDKEKLFTTMRTYQETETDNTKMLNYMYDYIASKYEDGTVGKKDATIELVLAKNNDNKSNGWLVVNDGELKAILSYENGVDVAQYIENEYDKWLLEKEQEEMREEMQQEMQQYNSTEATSTDAQ